MSKIGIDISSSSTELNKELRETQNTAQSVLKTITKLNDKLAERNRLSARYAQNVGELAKQFEKMKADGTIDQLNNAGNGSGSGNRSSGGSAGSASTWGGAIGAALTGNFGQILNTTSTLLGQSIGGPTGAFIGAAAGRVTSAVWGKLSQSLSTAERNMIQTSYLRRSIGGNPADFDRMYSGIQDASAIIGGMTNAETIQLFRTLAKTSGTSDIDILTSDSILAGQYGKAMGVDVNQTGRFFGQMRGIGEATSNAEMRRLGLVIAEAIGRTGAFAKSDEMMGAVSNYATQLSRLTLNKNSRAVENYAGMLSQMASGANKDISGFASLLGQVDNGVRSGGGMGTASHILRMMSYQAGYSPMINALDMRMINEQGAFGSAADVFKESSKYYQFDTEAEKARDRRIYADMYRRGNLGKSNIEVIVENLEKRTGGGRKLAYSLANEMHIQAGQAIDIVNSVHQYRNSGGVGNGLKKYGVTTDDPDQQWHAVGFLSADYNTLKQGAQDLLDGKGFTNSLTGDERGKLEKALASGNKEELRKVVINLSASRQWEEDSGKRLESTTKSIENKTEAIGSHLADIKADVLQMVNALVPGGHDDSGEVDERTAAATQKAVDQMRGGGSSFSAGNSVGTYSGPGISADGTSFTNDDAGRQAAFWANIKGESSGSSVFTSGMKGWMQKVGIPLDDVGKTIYHKNANGTTDWGPTQLNDGGRLQKALKKIGIDPSKAKDTNWLKNNPDIVTKAAIADYADEFAEAQKLYKGRIRETFAHHHLPGLMQKMYARYGDDWVNHPNERSRDGFSASLMIGSSARKMKLMGQGGTAGTVNTADQNVSSGGKKKGGNRTVNVNVKGAIKTESQKQLERDQMKISSIVPEASLTSAYSYIFGDE